MNQLKWTIVEDGYYVPNGIVSKHDLVYNANRMLVIQSTFWRKQAHGWVKALFMTVWCPDSRSVESNCGIPRG